MNAREGIDAKELSRIVGEVSSERGEAVMTIAEKLKMEGRKEGRKEGIIEGIIEGKLETAKNLLKMGMDIKEVAKATDIDEKKIELIKEEIKH